MICWRDKTFCSNSCHCRENSIECKYGRLFTHEDVERCDMPVCYGDMLECVEFKKAQVKAMKRGVYNK